MGHGNGGSRENALGSLLILFRAAKLAHQGRESPFHRPKLFVPGIARLSGTIFRPEFTRPTSPLLEANGLGALARRQTGAAGSAALASIRPCCLRSAQNSGGILAWSEL
jgi:hypothetical protein